MKKVIILGAGASYDFTFPSGVGLMKKVYEQWHSPNQFYKRAYIEILRKNKRHFTHDPVENSQKAIKNLAERLYYSGAESIDDFLGKVNDPWDVAFGKLTIVRLIWGCENFSLNSTDEGLFKWEENWLRQLFAKEFLFKDVEQLEKKIESEDISFITFNYDRSLEHFLFTAIKNYYGMGDPKQEVRLKNILSKISFAHIYGQLSGLEWQTGGSSGALSFGQNFGQYENFEELYKCASNIKVIGEDRSDLKQSKEDCEKLISNADKVHILGFGFHDSNWDLLGIDEEWKNKSSNERRIPQRKFFYTSFELSKSLQSKISNKFADNNGHQGKAFDSKIYEYMLHHYAENNG